MKVLYFAWIRERIGVGEQDITPPADVLTVAHLIDWLATQSSGHANAFKDRKLIKVARDHEHVPHDTALAGATEIAFFPPVTGG